MGRYWLGAFVLTIMAAASNADDAAKAELRKLEGTWQLVSAIKDGKETPAVVVMKIRVVIKEGKHTVFFAGEAAVKDIPFAVDPNANPKTTIDKLPDGKEIKGIYKLEGDRLTSCVAEPGKDCPTEFAAKLGSGHTLRVFERVKP